MKKGTECAIYPAALLLEQTADGTSGEVDGELYPFLEGQQCMLPFLNEIGGMTTVVLYFLYYSHKRAFIPRIFEYRREG